MFSPAQYNPESPSYLVYSGQLRRAERSLQWLKPNREDVSADLGLLQGNINRMKNQVIVNNKTCKATGSPLKDDLLLNNN